MTKVKNFNNRPGFIWLDGRFVKWNQAKLHVLSHLTSDSSHTTSILSHLISDSSQVTSEAAK